MNNTIGSFEWRNFDAACDEIYNNLIVDLHQNARSLRKNSISEDNIKVWPLHLGLQGKRQLSERILSVYRDPAYSDYISLFLCKVVTSFTSPYELRKDLEEIIKGTKEQA